MCAPSHDQSVVLDREPDQKKASTPLAAASLPNWSGLQLSHVKRRHNRRSPKHGVNSEFIHFCALLEGRIMLSGWNGSQIKGRCYK